MLFTPAYAQAAGGPADMLQSGLLPLVLIFVVFWFLLIRPQQKKAKQHREMLGQLRRGDQIITSGGLIGKVTKVVSETELQVEIAENVRVRVARGMVSEVLTKPEPVGKGEKPPEQPAEGANSNQKPTLLGSLLRRLK
jgi:preprotein translocase subunit YajC